MGELVEQLRLVLEPTTASRMTGDYKTGAGAAAAAAPPPPLFFFAPLPSRLETTAAPGQPMPEHALHSIARSRLHTALRSYS